MGWKVGKIVQFAIESYGGKSTCIRVVVRIISNIRYIVSFLTGRGHPYILYPRKF